MASDTRPELTEDWSIDEVRDPRDSANFREFITRTSKGTGKEWAKRLGISPGYFSELRHGKGRELPIYMARRITIVLGLPMAGWALKPIDSLPANEASLPANQPDSAELRASIRL